MDVEEAAAVLGIDVSTNLEGLKRAYKKLAPLVHPDRAETTKEHAANAHGRSSTLDSRPEVSAALREIKPTERFPRLLEAYELLTNRLAPSSISGEKRTPQLDRWANAIILRAADSVCVEHGVVAISCRCGNEDFITQVSAPYWLHMYRHSISTQDSRAQTTLSLLQAGWSACQQIRVSGM